MKDKKGEPVGERIKKMIDILEISQNKFGRKVGVSSTVISHWVNCRNSPNAEKLKEIGQIFPQFSLDWLIMGKEPILRENANQVNEQSELYQTTHKEVLSLKQELDELKEEMELLKIDQSKLVEYIKDIEQKIKILEDKKK